MESTGRDLKLTKLLQMVFPLGRLGREMKLSLMKDSLL
jgi:hypothetical protein